MRKHVLALRLVALLCATPLLFPLVVKANPLALLSLEQAQTLAAERSYLLSAARNDVLAAQGALQQAGTLRNPELSVSVEDTRSTTRSTTTSLGIPIELGGKRLARIGAADRARDLAQAELAWAQAQLRAKVVGEFFAVLIAQERVVITADSATLAERAALVIAKRVAAGKVSPVDETRARVDFANAQLEAVEAAAQLQAARQSLAALWGDAELNFAAVQGDVAQEISNMSVDDWATKADNAPGLLPVRLEAQRQQALVEVERSKRLPDLVLSVGAKRDREQGRTLAVVGLTVPLPLFDRNEGARYEAARRADKAQDDYSAARIQWRSELQQAAAQLKVAQISAQTLKNTVLPAAEQAYAAATRGFEAGKFAFLDVIDAQRSLLQARTRYLSALSTTHQATTAIDRLLGR